MGTRSTIALEFADGTIQQVYCHWDGYLDHNGAILLEHYCDPFKLRDLINLGDLSALGDIVGQKRPFSNPHSYGSTEYKEFEDKWKGQCIFYGRDRDEKDVSARKFANFGDYKVHGQKEEYNYILRQVDSEAVWYVAYYETGDRFIKLSEAIELELAEKEE